MPATNSQLSHRRVVEVRGSAEVRAADKNIAALASDGLDRTGSSPRQSNRGGPRLAVIRRRLLPRTWRLEALRRLASWSAWPKGYGRCRTTWPSVAASTTRNACGGVAVELKSHLPIERQARVIGATWLDQQLIGGGPGLGDLGFGGDAKQALQQRADFLEEQGLAQRRGQRVILARNLLGTLRNRELAQAAKDIATETGLEHRPRQTGSAWPASTGARSCSPAGATPCSTMALASRSYRGGR